MTARLTNAQFDVMYREGPEQSQALWEFGTRLTALPGLELVVQRAHFYLLHDWAVHRQIDLAARVKARKEDSEGRRRADAVLAYEIAIEVNEGRYEVELAQHFATKVANLRPFRSRLRCQTGGPPSITQSGQWP